MNLRHEAPGRLENERDSIGQGLAAIASVMAFGREISASWEAAALMRSPIFAGVGVPHGRGETVMVIPGLMAGDASMAMMRDWLRRIGYRPIGTQIGFNVGCPSATMERLANEIRLGGEKVTLIGHSKGGLVALMLAQTYPELVNQVITMGSPLADPFDVRMMTRAAIFGIGSWRRAHRENGCCAHCYTSECTCKGVAEMRAKLRRPVTSFYSQQDGVVNWQACLRPGVRGVSVNASHVGMAYNLQTYTGIAHLLAPQGQ